MTAGGFVLGCKCEGSGARHNMDGQITVARQGSACQASKQLSCSGRCGEGQRLREARQQKTRQGRRLCTPDSLRIEIDWQCLDIICSGIAVPPAGTKAWCARIDIAINQFYQHQGSLIMTRLDGMCQWLLICMYTVQLLVHTPSMPRYTC